MTERHVVVLGSGAAGTAAAIAARSAGARVTIVRGRTGATSLTSGALDGEATDGARSIIDTLGGYALEACSIATSAGTIRSASGRDLALADLSASTGAVMVARVAHPAWDGDALAAAYAELDPTRGYVARDVGLILHGEERAMQHVDLAALHDDDAHLARIADRIRAALAEGGTFGALLLPPWLGAKSPRARDLSTLAGIACGEVLASIDGPSGTRFEHARDRYLQNALIVTIADRATKAVETKSGFAVHLASAVTLDADAIVLATGGVLAGGIRYGASAKASFELTYEAPVAIGLRGRAFVVAGSTFGVAPESLVWPYTDAPAIERVGVLADSTLRAAAGVFVAGDALEGRARTMLAAFATGAAAGRAASKI